LKIPKPVAPYSVLILGPRGSGRSTMAKAIGDTVYAAVGKSVTAIDIAADQRFAIEKFVSSIEDGGHMTLIFENLDQTGNTNPASSYWKDLALLLKDGSHGRMRQSVLIATATIDAEAILNDAGMLPDRRRDFLGKHCREIPQDVLWLFQRVVVLEDLSMEEKAFVVLQELRQSISKSLDVHVDIDKSNRDLLQNVVAIVADDYRDGPFDCVRKLTDEVAGDLAELAAGEARRVLVTHDGVRVTAKRG
jgi:energy-coupling factor transporter ATP-binding protein EcfA2